MCLGESSSWSKAVWGSLFLAAVAVAAKRLRCSRGEEKLLVLEILFMGGYHAFECLRLELLAESF